MKLPKSLKGAMQGALVNQAYNTYCFGFNQAKENKELLSKSDFCSRIKEANEEGAKLNKKHNG